jgi:hypothetical protein
MIAAISEIKKPTSFLRDRYFPTDQSRDIFDTEDVLMDIRDGVQKMAPVVLPRKKGITVVREGYRTDRMTPPLVAPQRTLTLDDLESRGFGEALFRSMTAEQREGAILAQDLIDLDEMHSNREEYISAQCMINNGYVLPQYSDDYGKDENIPYAIQFYDGANNPAQYTPTVPWNAPGATIYADLGVIVRMLTKAGKNVSDFVSSPDVIDAIINDETIYKMLDNRNMKFGDFEPKALPEGASYYGRINVAGRMISLFSYEAEFKDDITGAVEPIFAPGQVIVTAPESGRGMYGAVKQIEEADRKFHTYSGNRVPKFTSDIDNDVRTLKLSSRPLFVPRYVNPWVSAQVFA